jgi:7,8-dihydropterin-6-yl-methyl-4-(beta-D-ribofuranosyl)aminobenzene 5'-phosphate synthase
VLVAEHGFSVLVTVTKAGSEHRFLFDTGASPDGVAENMRRLDIDPSSIEAIVCSHGHFDHTAGIDGVIRLARAARDVGAAARGIRAEQRRHQLPPLTSPCAGRRGAGRRGAGRRGAGRRDAGRRGAGRRGAVTRIRRTTA